MAFPRMVTLGESEHESASADFVLGARDFSRRGGPGPRDATPINVMSLFVAVMSDFATALTIIQSLQ